MPEFLTNLLAGKVWYKSVTVWGLIFLATGQMLQAEACSTGEEVFSTVVCAGLGTGLTWIGAAFTALGIRRAKAVA